ncbi:type II toxin-antitoxin system RelE/ParE family toxin [Pseudoroseicyclus sp. CXY001]|uniref:type II toxin-antitoxin system RelE/ParE family toxin n=1 Tax=Pseudoroseicyclus sp. CXY001 TaxID=3242492 RepID=UPI00358DCB54
MKAIVFTARAMTEFEDIQTWTLEAFGRAQVIRYSEALTARLSAIAAGHVRGRSLSMLTGAPGHEGISQLRAGQHLIVYRETHDTITILALPHGRRDLAALAFPTDPNEA